MKVRDSGMPERDYWETLFDLEGIFAGLGLDSCQGDAVEVGCGYGTFTLPMARRVSGVLHSFDIEPTMIEITRARLAVAEANNVRLYERDIMAAGFGFVAHNVSAVLLFNILHGENPQDLLRASAGLLRPGGRIFVLHWRSDVVTPRGPALSIRPRPAQVVGWARETGLLVPDGEARTLAPWHFGQVLRAAD